MALHADSIDAAPDLRFVMVIQRRKSLAIVSRLSQCQFILEPSDSDIAALVSAIQQRIARRGLYALMDERLKLICGDDMNLNNLRTYHAELIAFARTHHWRAEIAGGMATFYPK